MRTQESERLFVVRRGDSKAVERQQNIDEVDAIGGIKRWPPHYNDVLTTFLQLETTLRKLLEVSRSFRQRAWRIKVKCSSAFSCLPGLKALNRALTVSHATGNSNRSKQFP